MSKTEKLPVERDLASLPVPADQASSGGRKRRTLRARLRLIRKKVLSWVRQHLLIALVGTLVATYMLFWIFTQFFVFCRDAYVRILISLASGLSAVSIPVLWLALNLPELTQSLVTALITLDRDFAHTRIRGSLRLLGCVAGGGLGLLFVLLGMNFFLWWSVALIFGLALFAGLHLSDSSWAYVGTQGGIAYIMTLITGNGSPNSLVPVTNRLGGMMFGVLVTFGVLLAFQLCRPALSKMLPRLDSEHIT